jgi:hypothetical protein
MKKITLLSLVALCYACVVPKIELTEQEEALETKLKKEFACDDFEFRHDYHAIKADKKDASFMVSLCDGFCNKDSSTLCNEVVRLTKIIKPILSHRNDYECVWFHTTIEKHLDKTSSILTCDKTIKVSLRNLKVTDFSK